MSVLSRCLRSAWFSLGNPKNHVYWAKRLGKVCVILMQVLLLWAVVLWFYYCPHFDSIVDRLLTIYTVSLIVYSHWRCATTAHSVTLAPDSQVIRGEFDPRDCSCTIQSEAPSNHSDVSKDLVFIDHCRVCERCVLGYDHHCVWMDNCIGTANHSYFLMLLVHLTFGSAWFAFRTYPNIKVLLSSNEPGSPSFCRLFSTVSWLVCFFMDVSSLPASPSPIRWYRLPWIIQPPRFFWCWCLCICLSTLLSLLTVFHLWLSYKGWTSSQFFNGRTHAQTPSVSSANHLTRSGYLNV